MQKGDVIGEDKKSLSHPKGREEESPHWKISPSKYWDWVGGREEVKRISSNSKVNWSEIEESDPILSIERGYSKWKESDGMGTLKKERRGF